MRKVLVLSEDVKFQIKVEKGDAITIIGSKNASIPMGLVSEIANGNVEIVCTEDDSPVRIAFEIGKMVGRGEDIVEVYTDIKEIKALLDTSDQLRKIAKAKRNARIKEDSSEKKASNEINEKGVSEPLPEEKTEAPKRLRKTKAVKENEVKEAVEESSGKKTTQKRTPSASKGGYFAHVTDADIESFLKKNDLDEKFKAPLTKALRNNGANDVTIDIMVRTQIALLTEDKDLCVRIGELAKEAFKKKG